MKPLKPEDAVKTIDSRMIEAVNTMIKENLIGRHAEFTQNDLINKYFELSYPNASKSEKSKIRTELFEKHQLDFEQLYINLGWKVEYDKPAYNETYEASFKFTLKKKHLKAPKVAEKTGAMEPSEVE